MWPVGRVNRDCIFAVVDSFADDVDVRRIFVDAEVDFCLDVGVVGRAP